MSDENAPTSMTSLSRMIKSDTQLLVRPLGTPRFRAPDMYHQLLRASWLRLTFYFLTTFFLFNCLFSGLFMLDTHGFTHPDPVIDAPRFWQFFFFSIETVATVGYGNMVHPVLRARYRDHVRAFLAADRSNPLLEGGRDRTGRGCPDTDVPRRQPAS
jgi:hypothetical protein